MGTLLDDEVTWADFGRRHLDRRVSKAITKTLGLERPTLVQSRGIPVALESKDLLCRARTGSGKTLCYAVPLVQRLLVGAEATSSVAVPPLRGIVLVPTKELIAQVHEVVTSLLSFCYDVLTVEMLLSGQKYAKAELPTMLVTTPSSLLALLKQRAGSMAPLAETLKILVVDEADLMFSFGYEEDMRALCGILPSTYQAMLFSATLSEEVEQLKGLMLHKPVVLKLEEPRVTGKLSQFYLTCHKEDKYLILYTLLKLQLIQGKTLMFVKSVEAAYKMKILLERFSINSAVLNAELPHASRQNIIQAFNQSLVDLLIATDTGFRNGAGGVGDDSAGTNLGVIEEESDEDAAAEAEAEPEATPAAKPKKRRRKTDDDSKAGEDDDKDADADGVKSARVEIARDAAVPQKRRLGQRRRPEADEQYSLTRGVDLKGVSTVINADMPATVRDYVHRVGRCARGGASGTALTLCTEDGQDTLDRIIRAQASSGPGGVSVLKPLPMQMSDVERFRYRVEDMARGLTKKSVSQYRARELQMEALNSEKLKGYFEDHPEEKRALQRSQRTLRERKSVRSHLKSVPFYLVPEQFAAVTPVQQAVRDEAAARGGVPSSAKRRRAMQAKNKDPLQGFEAKSGKGKNARFTREFMEAKDKRIDPKTANVEMLPPLSGRKLWKLRHKKTIRKATDAHGERKRLTLKQKLSQKKFGLR